MFFILLKKPKFIIARGNRRNVVLEEFKWLYLPTPKGELSEWISGVYSMEPWGRWFSTRQIPFEEMERYLRRSGLGLTLKFIDPFILKQDCIKAVVTVNMNYKSFDESNRRSQELMNLLI